MTTPHEPDALFDMPKGIPNDLLTRFGIPPFTVFDRRQGYWQARRRRWIELGIDSAAGRPKALTFSDHDSDFSRQMMAIAGGTSVFDPVVAETMLRWYSPADGVVYDPFAGGSVRGIVAMALGRHYTGRDIRQEQIDANYDQLDVFVDRHGDPAGSAHWELLDGTKASALGWADMILTCPPYGDLEVYSDLDEDISTMSYDDFADAYMDAILHAVAALANNRFSVWVVGNYRDRKTSALRDLCGLTIGAHIAAGASYHTECIMVDPVGTGAIRASAQFKSKRSPIRLHQQCLVFCKGDPKLAAADAEPFAEQWAVPVEEEL